MTSGLALHVLASGSTEGSTNPLAWGLSAFAILILMLLIVLTLGRGRG